jgi:hypothetical protein
MRIIDTTVFAPSPAPGTGVMGGAYYCTDTDSELLSYLTYTSRSDTVEVCQVGRSTDNGRTWTEDRTWDMRFDHPAGTGRRHPRGGYVDPVTGRYLLIWTEGVLPTDDPLEGLRRWTLHYAVSDDGDRSRIAEGQIIHSGPGFDATTHMPGITEGRNCMMIGDLGCRPLRRSDGTLLIPVQVSPVGADGFYANPGGGYTYTDALVLLGRWKPNGEITWGCSNRIVGDPDRSTRGMVEPTIIELDNGRILCVMRGSNDSRPDLPGYRWHAVSDDGGETFGDPAPWTYDDGQPFFSPSATSQLMRLRDGRIVWFGNVCRDNPAGNNPRYPLIVAAVDPISGLVQRNSIEVLDDRKAGESEWLTLSNFYVREERETSDLLLYLPRLYAQDFREPGETGDFTADLLEIRFRV